VGFARHGINYTARGRFERSFVLPLTRGIVQKWSWFPLTGASGENVAESCECREIARRRAEEE
jgi:hypothetical protein